MKWALLTVGLDDIFTVKDLHPTTEGTSIRITNEENKEWLISIPDFLTISDLSNLRRFLDNKEGFNHYHSFKPPSRRDKKMEHENRKKMLNQKEGKESSSSCHDPITIHETLHFCFVAKREKIHTHGPGF